MASLFIVLALYHNRSAWTIVAQSNRPSAIQKTRRFIDHQTCNVKKATTMKSSKGIQKDAQPSPSHLIDARIASLTDWRGETLARVRALIREADPEVVEEWKWRGVPVWSHAGIICTGETYKAVVKLTFA
jgi:hypothetical protein